MRKNSLVARRNVRVSQQALVESIMTKVRPIIESALNDNVQVLEKLEKADELISEIYELLISANKDGQFDYTNSSKLGDLVNSINNNVKKIDRIVYQK